MLNSLMDEKEKGKKGKRKDVLCATAGEEKSFTVILKLHVKRLLKDHLIINNR